MVVLFKQHGMNKLWLHLIKENYAEFLSLVVCKKTESSTNRQETTDEAMTEVEEKPKAVDFFILVEKLPYTSFFDCL